MKNIYNITKTGCGEIIFTGNKTETVHFLTSQPDANQFDVLNPLNYKVAWGEDFLDNTNILN